MSLWQRLQRSLQSKILRQYTQLTTPAHTPCPICQKTADKLKVENQLRNLRYVPVYACPQCQHKFCSPLPSTQEVMSWYQGMEYFNMNCNHQGINTLGLSDEWQVFLKIRQEALEKTLLHPHNLQGTLRIAEVGCLEGNFLAALAQQGHQVVGFEANAEVVQQAVKTHGIPLEVMNIEQQSLPPTAFDLVLSFHTFEHLRDPAAALHKIWDALVPGGFVLLEVPCDDQELDNPDHFHFFTKQSLQALLAAEFSDVAILEHCYTRHNKQVLGSLYGVGQKPIPLS